MNSIGYNLRKLRSRNDLTQKQVSEATGISIHLINNYETNKEFPQKHEIVKFAKFYKVEIEEILIGK